MPVAKSYTSLKQVCEPYELNGKMYTKVIMKNGSEKVVRWYTDAQYASMYGKEEVIKRIKSVKEVLGFNKGFITIFKGDTYANLEWFQESTARYHRVWGWYFVSDEELPDLPEGVEPIRLYWDKVSSDGTELLHEDAIRAHIETLIYEESPSEYVGSIGDRIEVSVVIKKAVPITGYYGTSTFHVMVDDFGNEYVWNTASKTLTIGDAYNIKGTVKNHAIYKNSKQTILTRCSIL